MEQNCSNCVYWEGMNCMNRASTWCGEWMEWDCWCDAWEWDE